MNPRARAKVETLEEKTPVETTETLTVENFIHEPVQDNLETNTSYIIPLNERPKKVKRRRRKNKLESILN